MVRTFCLQEEEEKKRSANGCRSSWVSFSRKRDDDRRKRKWPLVSQLKRFDFVKRVRILLSITLHQRTPQQDEEQGQGEKQVEREEGKWVVYLLDGEACHKQGRSRSHSCLMACT